MSSGMYAQDLDFRLIDPEYIGDLDKQAIQLNNEYDRFEGSGINGSGSDDQDDTIEGGYMASMGFKRPVKRPVKRPEGKEYQTYGDGSFREGSISKHANGYLTSSNPQEGGFAFLPALMAMAPTVLPMIVSGVKWIVEKIKNRNKKPTTDTTGTGRKKNKKLDPEVYQYLERLKEHASEFKKIEKDTLKQTNTNPLTYHKNLLHATGYGLRKVGFDKEYVKQYIDHISKKKFGSGMAKKILESDESALPKVKRLKYSDLISVANVGRGIHTLTKEGMSDNNAKTLSVAVNEIIMSRGKKELNKNIDNVTKGGSVYKTLQNKLHKVLIKHGGAIEKRMPSGIPYQLMKKSLIGKKRANSNKKTVKNGLADERVLYEA